MLPALRDAAEAARFPADLTADFAGQTLFAAHRRGRGTGARLPAGTCWRQPPDAREFAPLIDAVYLAHLFAEVKIEQGLGGPGCTREPPCHRNYFAKSAIGWISILRTRTRPSFTAADPVAAGRFRQECAELDGESV